MNTVIENRPDSSLSAGQDKGAKTQGKAEKQYRILIVDDEPGILKMLTRVLGRAGYATHKAENGMEAVEAFKAGGFDLVISDFNMPGMNGLELLKALKSLDPSVRVITHVGGLKPEQRSELEENGVFKIIEKPADSHVILSAVESALQAPFENQEPMADNIVGTMKSLARILYVDDNESVRETMREVGEFLGFEIRIAASGKEALELFLKNPAEVIVSDYHMPEMNGLELLHAIKAIDAKAKVIIVSGKASDEERQALLDAGAFRVLQKPVEMPLLASTVNEALAERIVK